MKKIIHFFRTRGEELAGLFFPRLCAGCDGSLLRGEEVICALCGFHLPKTYFHNDPENPLQRAFWGRVELEGAAAYLYFQKGGTVQRLLHRLKYRDQPEIAHRIGFWYGHDLSFADPFRRAAVIVPVPLHPRKQRARGYNQSEHFAEGLAAALRVEVDAGCLVRRVYTQTQTRRGRYNRWENVENIFAVKRPERIAGKLVLLVDDVVTTGATLESCAQALLSVPGVRVCVVAMAYASG
jgi:ComF family protein